MNTKTHPRANAATGAKLLAILAIGAASGGCFIYKPGDNILGMSPADAEIFFGRAAVPDAPSSPTDSGTPSDKTAPTTQQQ